MNAWLVVAVLILGGALALAPVVWSWLDPASPARSVEKLLLVLNAWSGIRDGVAQVAVRGTGGEVLARVLYLSPAHLRVDVLAPGTLAGEMFALRPVGEEWLFLHHRPHEGFAIEARISAETMADALEFPTLSQVWESLRRGRLNVSYVPAPTNNAPRSASMDQFDIQGLPGRYPRIVLRVDPATQLPREVALYADPKSPPAVEIEVRHLDVNTGLELREVFRLDPPPDRWLSPTPVTPPATPEG